MDDIVPLPFLLTGASVGLQNKELPARPRERENLLTKPDKGTYGVCMTENDHTVNIPRHYHHGDLRAAALRVGLELISEQETDDLSLRKVARKVGVSANAIYRHFPNKEALMSGLAAEGLRRLAAAQHVASEVSGSGRRGFAATGKAYVRFAIDNPALFRLIFSRPAPGSNGLQSENEPAALLRANAADVARDGEDGQVIAIRAWSLAHGLAMLILDGQLEPSEASIDQVFDTTLK